MFLKLHVHYSLTESIRLPRRLDRQRSVLGKNGARKGPLKQHLARRWADPFNAQSDILPYDLTSTCFQGSAESVRRPTRG